MVRFGQTATKLTFVHEGKNIRCDSCRDFRMFGGLRGEKKSSSGVNGKGVPGGQQRSRGALPVRS